MLILACRLVQVFISLVHTHSLSLSFSTRRMEGGRGKERQAKERKQTDGGLRSGLERGKNRRGNTPTDDRLMNLPGLSSGLQLIITRDEQ